MSDDEVIERVAKDTRQHTFSALAMEEHRDLITAVIAALRAGDTLPNGLVVKQEYREVLEQIERTKAAMRNAATEKPDDRDSDYIKHGLREEDLP